MTTTPSDKEQALPTEAELTRAWNITGYLKWMPIARFVTAVADELAKSRAEPERNAAEWRELFQSEEDRRETAECELTSLRAEVERLKAELANTKELLKDAREPPGLVNYGMDSDE